MQFLRDAAERIASRGCVRAVLLQQRFTIRGTLYRVVRQIENIAVCVEKPAFFSGAGYAFQG